MQFRATLGKPLAPLGPPEPPRNLAPGGPAAAPSPCREQNEHGRVPRGGGSKKATQGSPESLRIWGDPPEGYGHGKELPEHSRRLRAPVLGHFQTLQRAACVPALPVGHRRKPPCHTCVPTHRRGLQLATCPRSSTEPVSSLWYQSSPGPGLAPFCLPRWPGWRAQIGLQLGVLCCLQGG